MPETWATLLGIAVLATVTYATRIAGYLLGTRLAGNRAVERVLESLPGAALAAVLATAAVKGTLFGLAAIAATAIIFYLSGRTLLALAVGLSLTVLHAHVLAP